MLAQVEMPQQVDGVQGCRLQSEGIHMLLGSTQAFSGTRVAGFRVEPSAGAAEGV